jgi:hypothetical protein
MRKATRMAVLGMVAMAVAVLVITPPVAAEPKLIWGYLYDSDGGNVTQSTSIKLVVVRDGTETTHTATMDTSTGIWSVSLDDWRQGDAYYVVVDGTPWGDANYRAHDRDTPSRTSWTMNAAGAEQINIQTFAEAPANFKPILAFVFLIILLLVSILLLGPLNRQTVDVAVTGKKKVTVRRGDRMESYFSYTCSYGTPEELTELGEIEKSLLDVRDGTLQRVSVSRILRMPDGDYSWHKPKLMEAPGAKKVLASEAIIQEKWFQGGQLQVSKGQTPKSSVFRRKAWMWGALGLPFVVLELAFLLGSAATGAFGIPPWLGLGMLLNLFILIVGILVSILAWRHVKKPTEGEKPSEGKPAPPPPGGEAVTEAEGGESEEAAEAEGQVE